MIHVRTARGKQLEKYVPVCFFKTNQAQFNICKNIPNQIFRKISITEINYLHILRPNLNKEVLTSE